MPDQPNVLFVMTDQQRLDTIAALGNHDIYTPNLDRLVDRGVSFTNAYSQCPVCVPARHNYRTGREMPTTGFYANAGPDLRPEQAASMEERCGDFLPRAMSDRGYRTFGIGKFHTGLDDPDLGYDERYSLRHDPPNDYPSFIEREHPEYAFIEQLHGERTEMYYMPQMSPLPAEVTMEGWAADRAVAEIERSDDQPFFGLVSFFGPHPPLAPPIPFNRIYHPDRMPDPIRGDREIDHMDEQIPWMNYIIWADDVSDARARALRARYYGEITYIDQCVGRILDAVEARDDAENTLICFYSDHGDHLGDHHAWQKESFFEQSANVPMLLSWPAELPADVRNDELVCLTDLFGIATGAAGEQECRDGIDVLGMLQGEAAPRDHLVGYYREPGTRHFKTMVRRGDWKYVYMANGGREQLFDLAEDPNELEQRRDADPDVAAELHQLAVTALEDHGCASALEDGRLRDFPYAERPRERIYQMGEDIETFPDNPADVVDDWEWGDTHPPVDR
jgi:choline-sulfatase